MKTLFITLLLLASTAIATNVFAHGNEHVQAETASQKTAVFAIEKMTCKMCPITIRKAMNNVDGVVKATVDFETKTATVVFDPLKTNTQTIALASTNSGYPAKVSNK